MTTKAKVTAKVTSKATPAETEVAAKPTPTRRTRTPVKKATPKAPVEKTTPPPAPVEEHEEVVELTDKEEFVFSDEDEVIATELGTMDVPKLNAVNYTIGEQSYKYQALNGNTDGQYPINIWVRDSKTLTGLQLSAIERMEQNRMRPSDVMMLDYADQNAILNDPHMTSFFAREGAKWENFLKVGDRTLRSSKVNYSAKSAVGNTERVVAMLMRRLDLGVPIIVRLWHSGIVFSINPPDKGERIGLVDALQEAHLDTLRRTNGLIHGTSSFYANRLIVNEFMRHVTSSNIDRSQWPNIMELMDHRDIQFMAWGIMAASHMRGYKLVEKCGGLKDVLDSEGKPVLTEDGAVKRTICATNHQSIIDFHLICQIDNSSFTEWQAEFISRKIDDNNPVPISDIEKYQSQGEMHKEDVVELVEGLSVILKAPRANAHIEIGERWINSVEKAVNQLINTDSDDTTKNTYINRQLEATSALDVAHWVKAFDTEGEIIEDREGIERVFRSLGNNTETRDLIFDKIRKHMSKRLAAVVAIPTFKCPACGNLSNEVQHNGTAFYTPLDMVSRFFILTARSQ